MLRRVKQAMRRRVVPGYVPNTFPPRVVAAVRQLEPALSFSVLDVGARGGLSATRDFGWLYELPGLRVIGVEPDPDACAELSATGEYDEVVPVALSSKPELRRLYITRNPSCASIYEPNDDLNRGVSTAPYFEVIATTRVECRTVDEQFSEPFDLVKVDVQGANHDIALGASRTLTNTVACWTDIYFEPVYRGISLFGEADQFMRDLGFRLSLLFPSQRDGYVRQGNALYVRDASRIDRRVTFVKLLLVAGVTRNPDLIEYMLRSHNRGFLSDGEADLVMRSGFIQRKVPLTDHRFTDSQWGGTVGVRDQA